MMNIFGVHAPLVNPRLSGTTLVVPDVKNAVESNASKRSDNEKEYQNSSQALFILEHK